VWKEKDFWYLLIGSKLEEVGGMLLLYRSLDLVQWEYMHPLLVGDISQADPYWTGTMWECPNLLDFEEKAALVISIQATPVDHLYAVYHTGAYKDHKFTSQEQGVLVHGGYFYAPQVMHLDDGRYLMWGWIKEGRSQRISEWAGWAGVMSLPLVVSLLPDGKLSVEPIQEFKTLRSQHWYFENLDLDREMSNEACTGLLDEVCGDSLEILTEFEVGGKAEFGLTVRCSPDGQEQTRIVCKLAEEQILVERRDSSVSPDVERQPSIAPLEVIPGERLKLHIFIDHSAIEIFANGGRTCLISRIYPLRPDSLGVGLFVREGDVQLNSLDIWSLESIW
jgi:beta-fructofuranosidase